MFNKSSCGINRGGVVNVVTICMGKGGVVGGVCVSKGKIGRMGGGCTLEVGDGGGDGLGGLEE